MKALLSLVLFLNLVSSAVAAVGEDLTVEDGVTQSLDGREVADDRVIETFACAGGLMTGSPKLSRLRKG